MNQLGPYKEYRLDSAHKNFKLFGIIGFSIAIYWFNPILRTSGLAGGLFPLLLITYGLIIRIYVEYYRLRIFERAISVQSIFGSVLLSLDEIQHYQVKDYGLYGVWIHFLPKPDVLKLNINVPRSCDGYHELVKWARSRNITDSSKS